MPMTVVQRESLHGCHLTRKCWCFFVLFCSVLMSPLQSASQQLHDTPPTDILKSCAYVRGGGVGCLFTVRYVISTISTKLKYKIKYHFDSKHPTRNGVYSACVSRDWDCIALPKRSALYLTELHSTRRNCILPDGTAFYLTELHPLLSK